MSERKAKALEEIIECASCKKPLFGQLAGAFYGESEIPEPWIGKLAKREMIASLADKLLACAGRTA